MKRYAAGKVYAYASGPAEFAKHAEAALRAALSAQVLFMRERFVEEMRRRGVPDETVAAYLENVKLDDESYALDEPRD